MDVSGLATHVSPQSRDKGRDERQLGECILMTHVPEAIFYAHLSYIAFTCNWCLVLASNWLDPRFLPRVYFVARSKLPSSGCSFRRPHTESVLLTNC